MLEVIGEDYIRTARAKGVSRGAIVLKHALKNALIPLVTLAGLQLPLVFSGALVTETVFTWPGMGRLFVDSIGDRKSTRLNSSHVRISYAGFCLKKKKKKMVLHSASLNVRAELHAS